MTLNERFNEYLIEYFEGEKMTTEITKKPEASLTEISETPWGSSGTDSHDMLIPRVLLMQAMSKFVQDGKCAPGDIIENINCEVLAKPAASFEFVPFMTYKEWYRYKQVGGKLEFLGKELWSPKNDGYQYEEIRDGVTYRNDMALNYFVLLANRLNELPFLISFRRSSYYAGKKLSSHFQVAAMKKLPPANTVFGLSCRKDTNDKGTYFVLDVARKRDSKKEELEAAYGWWKTLSTSQAKVADDEETVPF